MIKFIDHTNCSSVAMFRELQDSVHATAQALAKTEGERKRVFQFYEKEQQIKKEDK